VRKHDQKACLQCLLPDHKFNLRRQASLFSRFIRELIVMDLKGLSSNWKKLQASLQPKKSDPAKPASSKQPAPASTSSAQNGLKRKRPSAPATSLVGTKTKKLRSSTEKPQKSFQRREMGAIFSSAGKTNGVEETVKVKSEGAQVTIRSSADTQRSSRGVVGGERVNEGLSLTWVMLLLLSGYVQCWD
jgi:hypothetical protein